MELRWYTRKIEIKQVAGDTYETSHIERYTIDETVLQYREFGGMVTDGEKVLIEPKWSEWKDVPMVKEGE